MDRSFTRWLPFLSLLIIWAAITCNSKKSEEDTATRFSVATATEAFLDTLRYDDGTLRDTVDALAPLDMLGAWFSPRRDQPCSLVAVQYFFAGAPFSPTDSIHGFIKRVSRYHKGGLQLKNSGVALASFAFLPSPSGQVTSVDFGTWGRPIAGDICSDFFIGLSVDSAASLVMLADSVASHKPARSYRITAGDSLVTPLPFDLGMRAVFQYADAEPDTGRLTFELRWNKQNTDLDLYLVLPVSGDTVFWNNRTSRSGGMLDVDDNDGYGPEKIKHPFFAQSPDTAAELAVYYHGPRQERATKVSVLDSLNDTLCQTIGPCVLRPYDWWRVAVIDLRDGSVLPDSCTIVSIPALARRRKI